MIVATRVDRKNGVNGLGDKIPPVSLARGFLPLRRGSRGRTVERLQSTLNVLGYGLVVDGIFGPRTEAAVRRFQTEHGLRPDGFVGRRTWDRLDLEVERRGGRPAPVPPPPVPPPPVPEPDRTELYTLLLIGGAAMIGIFLLTRKG